MSTYDIDLIMQKLQKMAAQPQMQISTTDISYIREGILVAANNTTSTQPALANRLLYMKDYLFNSVPQSYGIISFYVDRMAAGAVLELLGLIKNACPHNDWCPYIHPRISKVSHKLFMDGSYANAACDAFIEINDRIKQIYKTQKPSEAQIPDGRDLVNKVFSEKDTILEICDRTTETGRNIHDGFRFMFVGAMAALRNPKAHKNEIISKEDAMRRIMFASMLMYKIDDAISYSGVSETQ